MFYLNQCGKHFAKQNRLTCLTSQSFATTQIPSTPHRAIFPFDVRAVNENFWRNPKFADVNNKNEDPIVKFLSEAKTRNEEKLEAASEGKKGQKIEITDEDTKTVLKEWYLRKLEENKWNHFINQMLSSRYTRPYQWDFDDPIPDPPSSHLFATDIEQAQKRKQSVNDPLLIESTSDNTTIDEFTVDYIRSLSDDFSYDLKVPYLENHLRELRPKDFEDLSTLREFFENREQSDKFHLDDDTLPFIPKSYYDPHVSLPAYRNHEAIITSDPRNTLHVPKGDTLENDKAIMLKHGVKPHKRQQDQRGVAYTPDFDFDLWNEDYNRPHSPINTYGYLPLPSTKGISAVITRRQLPQRSRRVMKKFAPHSEPLIEFRWKSRVCRHQYQVSRQSTHTVIKFKGNGRGSAGFGYGRAGNFEAASKKADMLAATHMISIPRYLNHSISHTLVGRMHGLRCIIQPKPVGYGERGPPLVKAICHCFGIRDFSARFEGKLNCSKFTMFRAVWNAFLRVTTPELDCEDRGQRMVEAFPETDKTSYQLPRGWSHDERQMALRTLKEHQGRFEAQEGFSKYDMTEEEKKKLPVWITGQPNAFWEGGMPDISKYRWRPDLIDMLNRKGPGGITPWEEEQIQKLLAEKIDPCDHQFRWMKAMIRVGKHEGLGFF